MAAADQPRSFHDDDARYILPNDASEWKRLDDMHEGINTYLGHKLSYAPIAKNIQQILEIGCGSGAWATQAAQLYPDATVTAIDITPLPPRPIPKNVKFQKVDVTKALPFELGSFDVIHARFVLVHLPDWEVVLQRCITLLKPSGWILVEDIDNVLFDDNGDLGLGIQKFYSIYQAYAGRQGVDYIVGSKLEAVLKDINQFSEVNTVKIKAHTNGRSEDPSVRDFGLAMGASFRAAFQVLPPKLVTAGITLEVHEEMFKEFNDPTKNIYNYIYMTWAKKNEVTTSGTAELLPE